MQRRAGRGARGARLRRSIAYPEAAAHDFAWRHRQRPYDLVVYQFGNSSHHDYEWAYALHYPGLVVLHDTHLHHARAALPAAREARRPTTAPSSRWNHPGRLARRRRACGRRLRQPRLYYEWPMVRGLVAASRLVAVHGEGARRELLESLPTSQLPTPNGRLPAIANESFPYGSDTGSSSAPNEEAEARSAGARALRDRGGRGRCSACFGGLTPEKRLPQILAAFRATAAARARGAPAARRRAARRTTTSPPTSPRTGCSRPRHRRPATSRATRTSPITSPRAT